jgi:hypothetical protein
MTIAALTVAFAPAARGETARPCAAATDAAGQKLFSSADGP